MKSFLKITLLSCSLCSTGLAFADSADCIQLQEQKNLIYAAHGYCFNDKDAQAKYGADCHTKKPSFSGAESKRLAQIEEQQKKLNCPKKD